MASIPPFCSAKKINTNRWVPRGGDQTHIFSSFTVFFFSFYFILNANITFIFLYPTLSNYISLCINFSILHI